MHKNIAIIVLILSSINLSGQNLTSSQISFKVLIDSVLVYGPFKAFEPRSEKESIFCEKRVFITYEIENNSNKKISLPTELMIGVDDWDDIFYKVEKYVDSIGKFVVNAKDLVLPAMVEKKYHILDIGQKIINKTSISYWTPLKGANRIEFILTHVKNSKNSKGLSTGWILIEEQQPNYPINNIHPHLSE